jgi:hypothetical protein
MGDVPIGRSLSFISRKGAWDAGFLQKERFDERSLWSL